MRLERKRFTLLGDWVSKLRKAGVTLPDSESKHLVTPVHQEVVKVDLVSNPAPSTIIMEQNTRILAMPSTDASVAMEIVMDNSTIKHTSFHCCKISVDECNGNSQQ